MSAPIPIPPAPGKEREMIPLSAINQYLFCPRRAALMHVEGIFLENHHTILGNLTHDHADLPGYEMSKGAKLLRALPVFSERLGLSGKCDVVEERADGSLYPVEYKKGRRRQFDNDDAQLCAQALCLEEMFGLCISHGAIFHAVSKRRREVEFTEELRTLTENAIVEMRRLIDLCQVPPAVYKPACEECSLCELCLPKATSQTDRISKLADKLFQTD